MSVQERISSARKPSALAPHIERWRERLGRLSAYIDDRINPIVLKELRQAVRGRFLSLMMLIFLLGQLGMLGFTLMQPEVRDTAWAAATAGKSYFRTLLLLTMAICLLFIPVYTAVRLGIERSEQNMDLIFISTLSPRSIVAGKFFASVLFTILLFSAAAPFMAVSYLLRGIDFPTIFVLMAFSFAAVVLCIQMGLFAACVTTNRIFRFAVATIFLGALSGVFGLVIEGSKISLSQGLGAALSSKKFWLPVTTLGTLGLFFLALLFQMTVSMISPPSRNRARPVRSMYSVGWLLSGCVVFVASWWGQSYEPLTLWVVFHMGLLSIGFFVVVIERDTLGPRLIREVPRSWFLRLLAFPHFSGIANGLFWGGLLMAATIALPTFWFDLSDVSWKGSREFKDILTIFGGGGLFAFAYATTGLLLHRALLSRVLPRHGAWVVGLVLFAVCGLTPLFVMMLSLKSSVPDTWLILTPFALLKRNTRDATAVVALIWAGVAFLGVLPILLHQFLSFRPPAMTFESALRAERQAKRLAPGPGPKTASSQGSAPDEKGAM